MFSRNIISLIKSTRCNAEEQKALLARYRNDGCKKSKEKLTLANAGWIAKQAIKYKSTKIPLEDIFQCGVQGLLRAMEKYDFREGCSFLSYAREWVDAFIRAELRDNINLIRVPASQTKALRTAFKKDQDGIPLTEDERALIGVCNGLVSFGGEDEEASPSGTLASEATATTDDFDARRKISHAMRSEMSEAEMDVVGKFYGICASGKEIPPMTLREIARHRGVTEDRVRQIRDKGLAKLRQLGCLEDLHHELDMSC